MNTLPDPLVPPELDLRGYEYMPLLGDRLFKSASWINATPDAKIAALRLWWHSYAHEVPASSLPDDDNLLSEYAGYGVMVKAWKRVKAQAMRGFVLCSDERWYHPTVAEVALMGWKERVRNREKQRAWRERNQLANRNVTVTDTVTLPVNGTERNGTDSKPTTQPVHPVQTELVAHPPKPTAKPSAPKGKRLPADWVLPKAWGLWALQERPDWNEQDVRKSADIFRDYWVPKTGKDATKLDGMKGWEATWRNWVRREGKKGKNYESRLDQQAAIVAAFTGDHPTGTTFEGDFSLQQ